MNIEELRKYEDEKIVEHLKAIEIIVFGKCYRCLNSADCSKTHSCMGCTLSPGDGVMGYVEMTADMMKAHSPAAKKKVEELFGDINHYRR